MSGRSKTTSGRDKCEECGAPLDPPDAAGNQVCHFCNKTYNTPPEPEPSIDTAASISITIDSAMARPARRARSMAIIITLIVVVAVGAGVVGVIAAVTNGIDKTVSALGGTGGSGKAPGNLIEGSTVVLDGEPGAPMRFVAVFNSPGENAQRVMLMDSSKSKAVWKSDKLGNTLSQAPLAVDGTRVFVTDESRLIGLDMADGHELWRQSLTDELPSPCETCLFTIGDRIIARTKDANVMAFDSATGAKSWALRLVDIMAKVERTGDYVSVLDETDGVYSIKVLDPTSGTVVNQLNPMCGTMGSIDHDAVMLTRPGDTSLYLAFDLIPGCWQRWDLTTGALVWAVELEDTFFDRGAWAFIDGETIYFASRGRETMGRIDTATGTYEMLPGLPDAESVPIAVHGNTLILRAKSSRGTPRYSLWGLDLTTGNVPWQYLFNNGTTPADEPDAETIFVSDDSRFSAHLEGDTVRIVTFDGPTKTIVTDAIEAGTGVSRTTGAVANVTGDLLPDFTPIAWRGSRLVVVVGSSMLDIETSSGSVENRWN